MTERRSIPAVDSSSFLLILAVWVGLLAAAMELTGLLIRRHLLGELLFVGSDVWWTVPLVDILLFLAVGFGLVVLRMIWPKQTWWQVGLWVFVFLAVVGVLYSFPAIHRLAMALLAAGVATTVVRVARRSPNAFGTAVLSSCPLLLIMLITVGVGVRGREIMRERRALGALPAAPAGTPNVLLIVLDTVRAIDLGLYGYDRPTTPELAELRKRGVLYRWAFSTAPWTLPSHASMLTGRLVHEMTADWMIPLDSSFPTLAQVLARRGYATAGFSANTDYVSAEVGLARGFAHFDDYSLTPGLILRSAALGRAVGRNPLVRRVLGLEQLLGRKNAPDISASFLRWTEHRQGQPWFALLNYYDAHRPYQPPEPYYGMFASEDTRPDPRFRQDEDPDNPWTGQDARNFIAAYDGAIAYLDAELAKLFAELERRGDLGRTVVILTSDHGEEFGEHRLYDHGHSLYQASLHVPLLLWLPDQAQAGREIEQAVSLRDLAVTIARFAGVSDPPFPGRSLARFWEDEQPAPDTVVAGVKKVARQPSWYPASKGDLIALATDSLRFIRNLGDETEELYNYLSDPWERVDLRETAFGRVAAERFHARTDTLLAGTIRGATQSQ